MAKMNLLVCDVCGDRGKDASTYTIKTQEGTVAGDLCEDDAAPIESVLKKLAARPIQRARGRVPVTTMEAIEAAKKERAAKK